MKQLQYQQEAVADLTKKTIKALNLPGSRRKIVFEAPTGAGKTVMACQALAAITDELKMPAKTCMRSAPSYGSLRANSICRATQVSKMLSRKHAN